MANIFPRKNKDGEITSYTIRVYKGRDSEGNLLKPYTTTFKPDPKWSESKVQKELQKAAILFEKQCKEGFVADNRQSFEQYANYVIELKEKNGLLKHKTIQRYKELMLRITPAIGYIKIQDLKPQHLNTFYSRLSQDGMNLKTGGKLSAKTILEYHRLIHMILEQAEKEMIVLYNAASKATPPKYIRKTVNYYELDEVRRIRRYLKFEPLMWQVALLLLINCGGRRGEIVGLKDSDFDFENNTVHIQRNLLYTKERGVYVDTLKTKSADRINSLPQYLMDKVQELILQKRKTAKELGDAWYDTGFLLTQNNGLPIHPDSITSHCSDFSKKYNKIIEEKNKTRKVQIKPLPHLNPHAFRHSHVSLLLSNGVDPLAASKRVGHASPTISYNFYGHLLKAADKRASEIFENIIK